MEFLAGWNVLTPAQRLERAPSLTLTQVDEALTSQRLRTHGTEGRRRGRLLEALREAAEEVGEGEDVPSVIGTVPPGAEEAPVAPEASDRRERPTLEQGGDHGIVGIALGAAKGQELEV